ncbi:septal ring lytic transglycosylase RlpA family protein [Rhodovibrio salinarum]|uniref:Endolytic peptidoglycan transglycosylase RlpA n=1 Tax=Rhodovibrio salinarum TaxID=1087 RepID=A0A934QJH0_9PROT|nr:septal ring lytic transglycosylase RlpA family protein [Rhodovibrio salinarum]MBK1697986.1 septal ring lytic transglycosylase RlpA family protein [Rhodovibrio salinarum]
MTRLTGKRTALAVLSTALLLGGCAETQLVAHTAKQARKAVTPDQPDGRGGYYKVGNPYQIGGVWYHPEADYQYSETGIASWYGPGFHGKTTANGETYNQNDLTAAHRTLPMPSIVRVTNLENGKSIKLRVNDRGPFARGRIIDVSARAAELLQFKRQGTAKVRVQVVAADSRRLAGEVETAGLSDERASPTRSGNAEQGHGDNNQQQRRQPGAQSGTREQVDTPEVDGRVTQQPVKDTSIFVQAGAFTQYANANQLRAKLSPLGNARIERAMVNDRRFFRVRLGPLQTVESADRLLNRVVSKGYTQARVVVD